MPAEVSLAEVAKMVPNGVICLVSSLAFHELTTQAPHYVWVAVERKARKPRIEYPPVRVFHFSGETFSSGIGKHRISHQTVQIYDAPKTIIDCFRWRKAVGLDVTLEATRGYLKRPDSSPAILMKYARICGVEKLVTPYLEAMRWSSDHMVVMGKGRGRNAGCPALPHHAIDVTCATNAPGSCLG